MSVMTSKRRHLVSCHFFNILSIDTLIQPQENLVI